MNIPKIQKKDMRQFVRSCAPELALLLLAVITVIAVTLMCGAIKSEAVPNVNEDYASLTMLELVKNDEYSNYKGIITQTFTFYNTEDKTETSLANGRYPLTDLINTLNKYFETSRYRVCSIGVIGSTVYVSQDTNTPITETIKVNIISFPSTVDAAEWIKLTETIHSGHFIECDSVLNYVNDVGAKHLIYVYLDPPILMDTPINDDNSPVVADAGNKNQDIKES